MSSKTSILASQCFPSIFITIIILVSLCSTSTNQIILASASHDTTQLVTPPTPRREALEIVIGGSPAPESPGNCPPPPPPPCPPPSQPPVMVPPPMAPPFMVPPPMAPPFVGQTRVQIATKVIDKFLQGVEGNPCNIKSNRDYCKNNKFGCAFLNKYKQQALYAIQFNECNIMGKNKFLTIDDFINRLPDISIFHANSNDFTGKIPVLSNLPYLFELDLSNNKYTGKFPVNVLGATNLTFLDLRFNQFEGPIPAQLFNLDVLALFINNNKFDQDLPSNLGSSTAAFITLANNRFTGPIPKSIGQASKTLLEILFLGNQFSGCLPYEIGLLKKARVFDVSQNTLTGPIPRSFACLGKMEFLVLRKNEFYGAVPEELCKLPHLRQLNLCDNYFTQVGPKCMELMRKGVLDVRDNCILGLPNQKSPETCAWFFNKPKFCEEGKMMDYLPCKSTATYLDSDVLLEGAPQPQPTVTYDALSPNYK